ncbi:MAG: hypothetical protein ABFS86_02350 [Planctomycetota bacterium]
MRRWGALLVAVVLLAAASGSGLWLTEIREEAGAPMSAARVPLGGFEPLAVSFLWTRALELEAAGGLSRAVANYRLITELSPHVGPAWALPAHVLVWTDSECGDAERGWRWVREGLDLLDRGLALNPDDPYLLGNLGLTFSVRICGDPEVRDVAERELGRMPEELAVETFARLVEVAPDDQARDLLGAARRILEQARARTEGN